MNGLAYYHSPVGILEIRSEGDHLVAVEYLKDHKQAEAPDRVTSLCIEQLDAYFLKSRKFFDLPLQLRGSAFQLKIWNLLLDIPFGKTTHYADLAVKAGDANSVRAVGLANGQNPVAIIVPCHRVIGKDGSLVGYGGGLDKKQWLLRHEGALNQFEIF
jgi:methylated-DNA-[protein]-cysteine S-methyltransferase